MRGLSKVFMNDLLNQKGMLHPILERVKKDHTLMLSIRENSINIYYRGGNILRIDEKRKGSYKAYFNEQYDKADKTVPGLPSNITASSDALKWIESFPHLKEIMDFYFSKHPKAEREFQQLIARENNDSTISNECEYFISDIEFADSGIGARFDMLAICWPASQRKKGNRCKAAFIEMKYADGALGGTAGLFKHLKDIDGFIANKGGYKDVLLTMKDQFDQLDQLGLMKFNKGKSNAKITLNPNDKPEVIFFLANHNPRSTKLKTILSDPQFDQFDQSQHFDLRFYVAKFAGYGLHTDCLVSLNQFRALLQDNRVIKAARRADSAESSSAAERGFMASCNENGKAVFSRIISYAKDDSMRIHWGTKGFSLNVDLDGTFVTIIYGYPPSASQRKQSIYTTMDGPGGIRNKTKVPEIVCKELWGSAEATDLFSPAGRELKCMINRPFTEAEVSSLLSWVETVARAIRQFGSKDKGASN